MIHAAFLEHVHESFHLHSSFATPFLSSNSTSCTERWEHFKHGCFLNELIRDKVQQGQLLL